MKNISEKILSMEEALAVLRCMRLSNIDETQALETLDDFALRVRKVTTAALVDEIIRTGLTPNQAEIVQMHWYDGKNTAEIGRELGITQSNAFSTLSRANKSIRQLMTPLIRYQNDIMSAELTPLYFSELMEISSALRGGDSDFACSLKNLRLSNGISCANLARILHINQNELRNIESGQAVPKPATALRYSALFDVTVTMKFEKGKGEYLCQQHWLS